MGISVTDFEASYRRYSSTVLRWARGIMGDRPDAEDAAQNAWLEAWKAREAYDGVRPFTAWLRMIVKRACWHVMYPERRQVETISQELMPGELYESAALTEGDAEQAVDAGRLRAAVSGLMVPSGHSMKPASSSMMDTLNLALAGNDNYEIAQVRGVSHQAVGDTMRKAIAALRRKWSVVV